MDVLLSKLDIFSLLFAKNGIVSAYREEWSLLSALNLAFAKSFRILETQLIVSMCFYYRKIKTMSANELHNDEIVLNWNESNRLFWLSLHCQKHIEFMYIYNSQYFVIVTLFNMIERSSISLHFMIFILCNLVFHFIFCSFLLFWCMKQQRILIFKWILSTLFSFNHHIKYIRYSYALYKMNVFYGINILSLFFLLCAWFTGLHSV